jgi:transcription elongation factor GreA
MSAQYPMTLKGAEKIKKQLETLKKQRPEIVTAIAEARAHGDLKENAEYHAAKDQQGMVEAKIRDLEVKITNARIVDVTKIPNEGKVIFGSTITLLDENDKEVSYQIVGEDEADIKINLLSVMSPLARSLIGKNEGDEITFDAPSGTLNYFISRVEYI